MGLYLGYMEKRETAYSYDTYFYNYTPLCEVRNGEILPLSDKEQANLLPESEKLNINFRYNFNSEEEKKRVDAQFSKNSLVLFDFSLSDLQDNINTSGERNPTGYRVQVIDMLNNEKIRPIYKDNVFRIIEKDAISSNFYNDTNVIISVDDIVQGDIVYVKLDDFVAGPFVVKRRSLDSVFYIQPKIKENNYTITGYAINDCNVIKLCASVNSWDNDTYVWNVFYKNVNKEVAYYDLMPSDEVLLESFRNSISNQGIENGKIDISNIDKLLDNYSRSVLTGERITKEIRQNRLNRLAEILTSGVDVDNTLKNIADSLCDLLIRYQNTPNVEALIRNIFEVYPEFLDKMKDSKIINEKKEKLNEELNDLQQKKESLKNEIETIRENYQTAKNVEQNAIEEKKNALLEMDEQYIAQKEKLDEVCEKLKIAEDINELKQERSNIKGEVDYLDKRKMHLENETKSCEEQFLKIINNPHDKMVDITFDGYMANKMLKTAAEWEEKESERNYLDFVEMINALDVETKEPEDLIEYLCKTIKTVRPEYNKNTIINIAICITQGFITVFSGEPGCGKTSICNIFAEVLGLNKINKLVNSSNNNMIFVPRYIPVSVERGWTSKRDFIGYFNPLSKTFDKNNKNLYEALNILDIEKKKSLEKFPFLILLDEANLSPIEYYWADFMNICDDLNENSYVNLGESHVYSIPTTLHFVATINNDHTTETLSPRLLDRAWIVLLPQYYDYGNFTTENRLAENQIELVTWGSMCNAFQPTENFYELPVEIQKIYDSIKGQMKKCYFYISPRVDIAIKKYWVVASKYFEKGEYETDAEIVALDYAIAQKILPQISGYSDNFKKWLEELLKICHDANLYISEEIIKGIIEHGEQMNGYNFFASGR